MKITVADALKEGNWDAASWSPRIADDTAFQTWVGTIAGRAAAFVEWRVGSTSYSSTDEPLSSILEEAEMHLCQEQLLLSAAEVADAARDPANPPFLATGADLRSQAKHRRARAEELLAPYDQSLQQRFARPSFRSSLGCPPLARTRFDEDEGRVSSE